MLYELDSMQLELILTAVGEKEISCPKNHPARANYTNLRKYLNEARKR